MSRGGQSTTLLVGGTVLADPESDAVTADVLVRGGVIDRVGDLSRERADETIDCTGRWILPGFIDAHSHADGTVFSRDVQEANLRQGVTTVITGQDGVGFAPGSGAYATEYFGSLNGTHPTYTGGGVAELLAGYDAATALNVGYLVPAGTVRHEVVGDEARPATGDELAEMAALVEVGMREGALGLSTGLDYVPGIFATTAELTALAVPVARHDGVHVSHMRGGYEHASGDGIAELQTIAEASGVRTHVSHFHGPAQLVRRLVDEANDRIELTFDAYPYRRGFTLLAMPVLPPALLALGTSHVVATLTDSRSRSALLESWAAVISARPDMGPKWAEHATIAHAGSEQYAWTGGMTLAEAAGRAARDPLELAMLILAASGLQTTAVIANPRQRETSELAEVFRHPRHVAGSDGIHIGSHPHPRAWGTFARFLARHVRDRGDLSLGEAVAHLSTTAAETMRLGARGRIRTGWIADLAIVDVAEVADHADYARPRTLATGIDDVLVGGVPVLRAGALTGATPGTGIRRSQDMKHEGGTR